MRWLLLYLAERLARDPALQARFHAAIDALRRSRGRRPPEDRVIDHADTGQAWQMSRTIFPPRSGDGARARNLIWTLGGGLLLLWLLLIAGTYGLWALTGDWAITQAIGISRGVGWPLDLTAPITSTATVVRNLVGPILAVIGVAVSIVILVVTALAARLLGRPMQG